MSEFAHRTACLEDMMSPLAIRGPGYLSIHRIPRGTLGGPGGELRMPPIHSSESSGS